MTKCLLVEPRYKTKYPNLALCKLSTKLKSEGNQVEYCKGKKVIDIADLDEQYDEIYITTLFTYEADIAIDTINFYKKRFKDAKINVGGILASLMPELIKKKTGIKPFIGFSKELDMLKPDYSLIKTDSKWDDFSYVFTSRGCINKCPYCAVPILEPEQWINPKWKDAVDLDRKNVMIHDNNLTSLPLSHFKEVCDFLKEHQLYVIFDNGFDCRLFDKKRLEALDGVKIMKGGLRFAFDNMGEEGHIQRAIDMCIDHGISKDKLTVFVLFNFNDRPEEAEYRMREIVKRRVRVYPQQYVPLDSISRHPVFVGKYWTEKLAREFRYFYLMMGYYIKYSFPEWLENESKTELLNQYNSSTKKKNVKVISVQRIKQEGKIREYNEVVPTIQTPTGGHHLPMIQEGLKIRRLTPVECERLQGFPDNWTKDVSDTQRYTQLGNSVSVPVIKAIGKKIFEAMD